MNIEPTEPRPMLSPEVAAELLVAAWPGFGGPTDAAGPFGSIDRIALEVAAVGDDPLMLTDVVATFDAAEHVVATGSDAAVELVLTSFVGAVLCATSHRDDRGEAVVRLLPVDLWRRWHQTLQALEARSIQRGARRGGRVPLRDQARVYRAENGRLVDGDSTTRPVSDDVRRTLRRPTWLLVVVPGIVVIVAAVLRYVV